MCGRFNMNENARAMADHCRIDGVPQLQDRFNIAPSQLIPVAGLRADGTRGMAVMQWGFIHYWSQGDNPREFINARSETAADKPTFRDAFRRRRCLIPVSGF